MPDVGDHVRVVSAKVGQGARDGVVTAISGTLVRIKWSTGTESTMVPGPGSLELVEDGESADGNASQAAKTGKAAKADKPAKAGKSVKAGKSKKAGKGAGKRAR
jgi:hypothetical protein